MTIFYYHQLVLWQMKELLPLTDDHHETASEIARTKAAALNESFTEPLKLKAFEKALRYKNEQNERPKNLTLSAYLRVTQAERQELQLRCLDDPVAMVEREERIIEMLRAGHRNRDVVKVLGVEKMQVSRMRKKLERVEGLPVMPRSGWRKEEIVSA
jgi:DNA-directed RNA polymerase specialized sigma subunit